MRNTRLAIIGGRGMLGTDLTSACARGGFEPVVLDLPAFDLTNADHVRRAVSRADLIVNCAAYTNVDGAESNAELAYQVNADAVGQLGAIVREAGKWLLHISTDFVFDGRSDHPYVETDPACPMNTYGRSKLAGEQLLLRGDVVGVTAMPIEMVRRAAGHDGHVRQRRVRAEMF